MKLCTKCRVKKPLTEFQRDKHNKDGFTCACKTCRNAATKECKLKNLIHNAGRRIRSAGTKQCSVCAIVKARSEFARDNYTKDGFTFSCTECRSRASKQWQLANPDKVVEANRKYRTENHEKALADNRKYRAENAAKEAARCARYRESHRAEMCAASKRWQKANPEVVKSNYKKYRAENSEKYRLFNMARRTKQAPLITEEGLKSLVAAFGGLCAYCRKRPFEHLDHVVPIAKNGSNSIDNLLPACEFCNSSKGAKDMITWLTQNHERIANGR